ncbi:MAG: Rrf2 family transcriptional regulator [Deltaproteobacteria bacterium]|nr:Rrf2 family transcriptional regulator [Deltaproteobacteria bacterium]
MQFPKTSEYALRVMVEIGRQGSGEGIKASDLSRMARVPLPFLFKVLRSLVRAKLLSSCRGPEGGYRLVRSPDSICIREILSAVGYQAGDDHCLFGWKRCGGAHPCPLHPSWKEVKEALQDWTEKTTLGQIS